MHGPNRPGVRSRCRPRSRFWGALSWINDVIFILRVSSHGTSHRLGDLGCRCRQLLEYFKVQFGEMLQWLSGEETKTTESLDLWVFCHVCVCETDFVIWEKQQIFHIWPKPLHLLKSVHNLLTPASKPPKRVFPFKTPGPSTDKSVFSHHSRPQLLIHCCPRP